MDEIQLAPFAELQRFIKAFAFSVVYGPFRHPEDQESFVHAIQSFSEYLKGLENYYDLYYVRGEYGCYISSKLNLKDILGAEDLRCSDRYWYLQYLAERENRLDQLS